jgi:hypothetical protein
MPLRRLRLPRIDKDLKIGVRHLLVALTAAALDVVKDRWTRGG